MVLGKDAHNNTITLISICENYSEILNNFNYKVAMYVLRSTYMPCQTNNYELNLLSLSSVLK